MSADDAISAAIERDLANAAARRKAQQRLGARPDLTLDATATRGGTLFPYTATVAPTRTRVYRYDDTVKVRKQQARARRRAALASPPPTTSPANSAQRAASLRATGHLRIFDQQVRGGSWPDGAADRQALQARPKGRP